MPRLIDADVLRQTIESKIYWGGVGLLEAIDEAPIVDAVPVVRCKDCKHFVAPQGVPVCDCFYGLGFANADDFCSYGERRTDDEQEA